MKLLAIILLQWFTFEMGDCSKILYLMPFSSSSHRIAFNPLITELANRGHHITVVSSKSAATQKNVNEVVVEENVSIDSLMAIFNHIGSHPLFTYTTYKSLAERTCINYFKNPEVKNLLKIGKQFDLVIVSTLMNDCALATAPLLGDVIMYYGIANVLPWSSTFIPAPPSYVPNMYLPYTSRMTFFQRLNNLITNIGMKFIYRFSILPSVQKHVNLHVPEAPSVYDVEKHVSFTLQITDPVLNSPRPTMPNIIDVGGMQCGKAKPIPKIFEDFMQSSEDNGVILFSLGSVFPSSVLNKKKVEEILKMFNKLQQKIIWKYEKDLENVPPNVMISKWLPLQDLLGHPKTRLFITHGGLLSLQESVYHGVPVVAIPLFADQPSNVARVEELKIGCKIDFHNLSGDSIYDAITTVLEDKSYSENVKKYSTIFKDQPQSPVERAVFWAEYVIRHKGAPHFRSPGGDLNFFQYFLLDVIVVILVIIFTVLFLFYLVIKFVTLKIIRYKNKYKIYNILKKKN